MSWMPMDMAPETGEQILVWLPRSVTLKDGTTWGNFYLMSFVAGDWMTNGGMVIDDEDWLWQMLPEPPPRRTQ